MTANRVDTFEAWIRSVEKRVIRLERKPRSGGGGGVGIVRGVMYQMDFANGEAVAALPDGVSNSALVVGSLTFESGEEVGVATSVWEGGVYARAAVSDGIYDVTLIFVEP